MLCELTCPPPSPCLVGPHACRHGCWCGLRTSALLVVELLVVLVPALLEVARACFHPRPPGASWLAGADLLLVTGMLFQLPLELPTWTCQEPPRDFHPWPAAISYLLAVIS